MADQIASSALEYFVLTGISFGICLALVVLSEHFPRLAGRVTDLAAVQAAHSDPTPRVAGIAVFCALAASIAFAPSALVKHYAFFIAATSLLFTAGLLEDVGFLIQPRVRLLAAVVSSLLIIFGLDMWLIRSGFSWFDPYMAYWPIGIAVTVFVTTGVANGFNLIDGVNGLAAFTAMACAVSLAFIANEAGYSAMVKINLMLACSVLGFALLNVPYGKIFLGDAGAYTLGFLLSWFSVSMLVRFPEISPWAVLLTVFLPVADTCLAIYRRVRRRSIAFLPDRLHVHQLVMRALEIVALGRGRRHLANPLTTLILAPLIIAPPLTGIWLWNDNQGAGLAVLVYAVGFFGCYVLAFPLLRVLPRKRNEQNEPKDSLTSSIT